MTEAGRSGDREGEHAAAAGRSALDRAADAAIAVVSAMPALALVATLAALIELALARIGWHGFTERWAHADVLELGRWARFPRNLAAIAGVGSLVAALLGFLRLPGYAPIGRRLAVAAFSGIFVPSIVVAALLPRDNLRPKLVIFGLAAANVLVTLIGLTALRHRNAPALRAAVACVSAASFLTLSIVGLGQVVGSDAESWGALDQFLVRHAEGAQRALILMRHAAELAWTSTLVAGAVAIALHGDRALLRRRTVAVAIGAVLAVAAIVAFQSTVGHRFRFVLFGAFRLGLFVDDAPGVYALPLGIGLGAGLAALVQREPITRQLGAAVLIWFAAGFAPHTPIQLLYMTLASLLFARVAQAWDPNGAWRTRQPWARLTGRATMPPPAPPRADPAVENETFDDLGRAEK